MDNNGKIFGKISIIDLLVILAVVVAGFGFSVRFFSDASENVNEKTRFEYVVELENVRVYTYDALMKKGPLTEDKSNKIIGEIIDVQSEPYKMQKAMTNGRVVNAVVPEKYVIRVTVQGEGNVTENGYYIGENTELSVGSSISMASKYANSNGKIISVKVLDE